MQRRTPQLRHVTAVTLFLLTLVALTAFLAVGAAPLAPAARVSAHGLNSPLTSTIPLVINEVYDSQNPLNEYVELFNTSTTAQPITIDLRSYILYNSDTVANGGVTGTVSLSLLPSSLQQLRPQQHLVITPAELGQTALVGNGLSGTGDYLAIKGNSSDTVPVDLVNWGIGPLPSWNEFNTFTSYFFRANVPSMPAADGPNSLSRYPDGVDTDSGLDWRSLPFSPAAPNTAPSPTVTPTGTGVTTTPTVACDDQYEPDSNQSQSKELIPGFDQIHTLCRSNGRSRDVDWVRFAGASGKQYTMLTKNLSESADTIITLYNSDGDQLDQNDDYPGGGLASKITYVFTQTALYYLQIADKRANGGVSYQYTVSLTQDGVASPTVTPTSNVSVTPTSGPCYDAYEPDGVPETARNILIGTTQHHSICPTGDADWVRFYSRAGKVYTIRTSNLGVGLDTFIILFASDAKTILAQNDDGGDGVASRIDFYPQKDDWYFAQIKNAGDIGGSDLTYDLSLAVVPGVPQPPGTATSIIAPPITVTSVSLPPTAGPTQPPVPTPTQGNTQPTPTARTTTLTAPEPTARPTVITAPEITTPETEASPVQTVLPLTGEINATSGSSATFPNMPNTGRDPSVQRATKPISAIVAPPQKPQASVAYAPVLFRVFYDGNRSQTYAPSQGIRGLKIYFLNSSTGMTMSGQIVTSDVGAGNATLPVAPQRVYIPYLGINVPLTRFPDREIHSFWLQPVQLPERVP